MSGLISIKEWSVSVKLAKPAWSSEAGYAKLVDGRQIKIGGNKMKKIKIRFDEKSGRKKEGSPSEKRITETEKAFGIRDYHNPHHIHWIPKAGVVNFDGKAMELQDWAFDKLFPCLPQFAPWRQEASRGEVVEF